jgi:hypothetical protein
MLMPKSTNAKSKEHHLRLLFADINMQHQYPITATTPTQRTEHSQTTGLGCKAQNT